jgi:proton-dependent oligopeptide transporter, POT family
MSSPKQPQALPYLFLTEMWERFGFYVVQGMLVLYMSKSFGFSDDQSYTIQGAFTALAYIAPIIGGFLADRVLGFKTSIVWGGAFLSLGYFMLALPYTSIFYLSLATIITGNGLFKPNISSLLGTLYEPGDTNREAGFTIFYIGINIGSFLAGISSGYIKDHFGWHAGFGLACIGLLLGLVIFSVGMKKIASLQYNPLTALPPLKFPAKILFLASCVVIAVLLSFLLQDTLLSAWLFPTIGVVLLVFLLTLALREKPPYRQNLLLLTALILSSIVYWMFFLQIFFSANLFVERLVDKNWLGMHIPTTVFYALEAVFVILLGPAFAWSWSTLNLMNKNPPPFLKFILAIALAGCGFLTLSIGTHFPSAENLVNPLWVVLAYLLITMGELLLSPIGLSAVTTLSPRRLVGMMMGIWFVALGFGGQFAGWLAKLSNIPETLTDTTTQLTIYRGAFLDYFYIAIGIAGTLFVMQIILKMFLKGERDASVLEQTEISNGTTIQRRTRFR